MKRYGSVQITSQDSFIPVSEAIIRKVNIESVTLP
jgi:hypothetical protein